ncbi:MAG TPA: helix-hairpin-helix domain-containing protein, partial [Spirochaetota bacterium]|nr:helix-hairpin-helix domain-containing protein [Spirochaetota bacterium]
YGIRQHPYLGLSHSFAVTVATGDIPFEQIPYTEPVMTRREAIPASQKLDINNCVIEELRELPLMTDALAARIMQHRRMIGPVNARILEQLGMSRRDIAAFRSYARWDDPKKKREWSPRSPKRVPSRANAHERTKALFRQLLESGLTAADALDLSELAGSAQPAEIERRAAAIRGITESTRRLVVKLCTGR